MLTLGRHGNMTDVAVYTNMLTNDILQILSGRRSKQRQSEFNLAVTLVSIVFMHIVCNALRVFLGVLVVALVGKQKYIIKIMIVSHLSLCQRKVVTFQSRKRL